MLCFGDRVILYCSKGRWCLCVSGQSTWLDSTNSHACSGHGSSVSCRFRLFKHRTWGFYSLVLFFLEFPTTLLPSWLPWAPFPGSSSSSNQRDVRLSVAVVAAPVPLVVTASTFRAKLHKMGTQYVWLLTSSYDTSSKVCISVFRALGQFFCVGSIETIVVLCRKINVSVCNYLIFFCLFFSWVFGFCELRICFSYSGYKYFVR